MDREIYIVRHGRTDYNRRGIWQGSGVDAPLDDVGKAQAEAFFKRYEAEGFDVVIHSQLLRSKQTVSDFVNQGIPRIEVREINEISWGKYEGKPHTEESYTAYKTMIGAWSRGEYSASLEGGESAEQLFERIGSFREMLETLTYKKILICSHGRAIRALISVLKNENPSEMEKYEHANTGLFVCDFSNSEYRFSIYNNTDHLAFSS